MSIVLYGLNKLVFALRRDSKLLIRTLVSYSCEVEPHLLQLCGVSSDGERTWCLQVNHLVNLMGC